jgi:hypothetical protein
VTYTTCHQCQSVFSEGTVHHCPSSAASIQLPTPGALTPLSLEDRLTELERRLADLEREVQGLRKYPRR